MLVDQDPSTNLHSVYVPGLASTIEWICGVARGYVGRVGSGDVGSVQGLRLGPHMTHNVGVTSPSGKSSSKHLARWTAIASVHHVAVIADVYQITFSCLNGGRPRLPEALKNQQV